MDIKRCLSNHAIIFGNVAIGYTPKNECKEPQNVAIGDEAGRYATGSKNTFVGHRAGLGSTSFHIFQVTRILQSETMLLDFLQRLHKGTFVLDTDFGELIKTGNNNTYIGGYRTGYYNHAGDSNVGIGNSAIGVDVIHM